MRNDSGLRRSWPDRVCAAAKRLAPLASPRLWARLASLLARPRPPGRRPGWRFGGGAPGKDPVAWLRLILWEVFRVRRWSEPSLIRWYEGIRFRVFLGNDLSRCLYVGGCYEPNEFAFLGDLLAPGMVFLDVGANDGLYSLFASKRVGPSGRVLAVEPSRRERRRLEANLRLNAATNIRVFPEALYNRGGEMTLNVAGYEHEGQNTLGDFHYEIERAGRETVPVRTLDERVRSEGLKRLDAVKIDAEGAEYAILEGAADTLRTLRPVLLLELLEGTLRRQGGSAARLVDLLNAAGYDLFRFHPRSGRLTALDHPAPAGENVVAIPRRPAGPGGAGSPVSSSADGRTERVLSDERSCPTYSFAS